MKKVKISIRICGKTATANLLYVHIGSAVKNGWLDHWAASGGKKYDGKPVKCWELWEQVHEHLQKHKIGGIHG